MWRGRMVISQEGRAFREDVRALLDPGVFTACQLGGYGPRKPPYGGRIALCMDAFPPDRRRRDLDNIQKSVIDAMQHAGMYEDDSQIDLLLTRRGEVIKAGRIEIQLHELPLRRCLMCGHPLMDDESEHPHDN
jgi:crossover junction endodeoxyribonuclease RusA